MGINFIEHYLISAKDIEVTKDFYTQVLGMVVGYRPPFTFPGYWLYIKEKPLVHLVSANSDLSTNTGALDHIAFAAEDLAQTLEHLMKCGINFRQRTVPEENDNYQLFFKDPDGIGIELNFKKAKG